MARGLPPFSSLFYTTNSTQDTPPPSPPPPPAPPAWMWPSCKHPRTQSFRAPSAAAKTIASLVLDSGESSFANSSARTHEHGDDDRASDSLSTESEPVSVAATAADDMADAVVRGLRSDRIIFEPRAHSSSILEKKPPPPPSSRAAARRRGHAAGQEMAEDEEEASSSSSGSFGGGVAVAVDSADPYRDFRASMEEMVAAKRGAGGGDGWEWLERMLAWYLGANGRDTHPAIITAFVDLVVCMAAGDGSSRVSSFTLAGSDEPAESSSAGGGHFSFCRR